MFGKRGFFYTAKNNLKRSTRATLGTQAIAHVVH